MSQLPYEYISRGRRQPTFANFEAVPPEWADVLDNDNVAAATIQLEAEKTYIVHVVLSLGSTHANGNVGVRLVLGDVEVVNSLCRREPDSGQQSRFHHYRFLTKITPIVTSELKCQFNRHTQGTEPQGSWVQIANLQMLALDVSGLVEDDEYYFEDNASVAVLPIFDDAETNNDTAEFASVEFDVAAESKWLVIGMARIEQNADSSGGYNVHLDCDEASPRFLPHYRVESEDEDDIDCTGHERVYEFESEHPGTKFSVHCGSTEGHDTERATHLYSSIFAINLALFESKKITHTFQADPKGEIPGDNGNDPFVDSEEIALVDDFAPTTESDLWILGGFTISDDARDRIHYRLRYNEPGEGEEPDTLPDSSPDTTHTPYAHESYFSSGADPANQRDRLTCYRSVILPEVPATPVQDYRFEADSGQGSDTANDYFDEHLYVISLELAAAGGETQDLEADIAAVSTVTASLSKTAALDADIAAASTVTASLSKIAALDADIAAVSTVTASFEKLASLLDADIAAVSTVTASLERIRPLDAGIAAASTVTASLSKTAALDAGIAATSTVTASLERVRPLDAGIAATSTVTASLERIRPLDAGIAAASTVTVSLKGIRALDADITAASTVTVSLERIRPLDADIAATSSVVVDFGVSEAIQSLSAGIAAASTVSASMQKTAALSASINAVSTVQGSFALPGVFVDGLENDFEVPSGGRDFTIASGGRDVSVPAGGRNFTIGSV